MKRFLAALIVLMVMSAQVEATPFTRSQLDNIFLTLEQGENSATFDLDAESLKKNLTS